MVSDNSQRDKYTIRGGGFHCTIFLDLREVESIQRTAFWRNGWWFSYKRRDGSTDDIHVREDVDVLRLFRELKGNQENKP